MGGPDRAEHGNTNDYADAQCSQELTATQDSPEAIWGLQWRHLFGTRTFAEVKYTGWWGYFYLDPQVPGPISFDGSPQGYSGGAGYTNAFDRTRNQINASISHYAEAFGKHDLKFGVEIERSKIRSQWGYNQGIYYYDYTAYYPAGQYLAYEYSYDLEGRNQRESFYAQDSWKPTERLTINAGGASTSCAAAARCSTKPSTTTPTGRRGSASRSTLPATARPRSRAATASTTTASTSTPTRRRRRASGTTSPTPTTRRETSAARLVLVGVAAGIVPALKASRLDPVDALRYE